MTAPRYQVPALVCDMKSDMAQPVVISDNLSSTDALCALARLAANFSPDEVAVVLWTNGLANPPIVMTDDRLGWCPVHPDAWDVPEWPGLDLGEADS